MVVHHVEMDEIRARGDDVANLLAQAREIRRKDAWGDAEFFSGHGSNFTLSKGVAILRGNASERPRRGENFC